MDGEQVMKRGFQATVNMLNYSEFSDVFIRRIFHQV
jgi:hypothetical protein